jgi:peptidoglycan/LPS O-acetylase OafA/YrhL
MHEYLTHLDGLRAVALLGVLLFHFQCPGATGGFVGVDCFLVLSGFLYALGRRASPPSRVQARKGLTVPRAPPPAPG